VNDDERLTLAAMEREWPHWKVWTVHTAVGATIWRARPRTNPRPVLNASSATELAQLIVDAEAGL
jgi:hypothetical protein